MFFSTVPSGSKLLIIRRHAFRQSNFPLFFFLAFADVFPKACLFESLRMGFMIHLVIVHSYDKCFLRASKKNH